MIAVLKLAQNWRCEVMVVTRARLWILVSTALLLSSCGGGGGPAPPNNFTVEAVKVVTSDPRIGHPLTVSVQVKADQPANNVGVSLFAIDNTSDPNVEVRQIPLGTEFIEDLPAGSSNHELNMTIPSSVEFAGPYHIAAVVDPVDQVVELDEEDNTSTTEVDLGATNAPNILLADVALDRAALIINTDEYLITTVRRDCVKFALHNNCTASNNKNSPGSIPGERGGENSPKNYETGA